MSMPPDLDEEFKKLIPPFGASGNPIDITGGEPPETYKNAILLGLRDPRVHSLILGYWHTIITPPLVFADLVSDALDEAKKEGIIKPVVASLAGDIEVEEATTKLRKRGVVAYPYAGEKAVAALGVKSRVWRNSHSTA